MAETSGFFEAELNEETNEWDREYFASQFAAYFRLFFGNGVFGSPTNQLQVIAGEGLKLVVRAGWAFIEGYWYYNDSDLELMVSPNTSAFDRIDSVICRLNVAERRIRVIIAEDTTELIRDGSYYDLKLATVTIGVAATSVTDANIVDTRMDESVCGIVTSVMKIQPTADLFAQFTDMFNTWFEGIKEQLSTDAAGNLQNQIGLLDELHTENKTSLVNAINELLIRDVDVLDTYEEIMANTTPGKSAGGLGVKEGFAKLDGKLVIGNAERIGVAPHTSGEYIDYQITQNETDRLMLRVYVNTQRMVMYKTTDNAQSWTKVWDTGAIEISGQASYTQPTGSASIIQVVGLRLWVKDSICRVLLTITNTGNWTTGGTIDIPISGFPSSFLNEWKIGLAIGANFVGVYKNTANNVLRLRNLGSGTIAPFERYNVEFTYTVS